METHRDITLPDGRRLAYAEYGDRGGVPVIYFHGYPSTRLMAVLADEDARRLGVRIVAPDRPGFGGSHFQRGRRILDWPDDVLHLADALELDRFSVAGVSGGGPYAAACAWKIPDRLRSVGLIAALAPPRAPGVKRGMRWGNRIHFFIARWMAPLSRSLLESISRLLQESPERVLKKLTRSLPSPDRELSEDPEVRRVIIDAMVDAFQEGIRGPAHEVHLLVRPWGFDPAEIRVPVHLWQGERDVLVPPGAGRYFAGAIPGCQAHFSPDDGHLTLPITHREEILRTLKG